MGDGAASQITKNCHYVSRFLTKPWEFEDRRLWYYDFDSGTFDRASSRSLFAEDEINSPEVETWLGEILEAPLSRARPQLIKADPRALDDWQFFRAAVLMLWLQGFRASSVEELEDRRHLDEIARLPIPHLDTMVQMIGRDFTMRLALRSRPTTGSIRYRFRRRALSWFRWATRVARPGSRLASDFRSIRDAPSSPCR